MANPALGSLLKRSIIAFIVGLTVSIPASYILLSPTRGGGEAVDFPEVGPVAAVTVEVERGIKQGEGAGPEGSELLLAIARMVSEAGYLEQRAAPLPVIPVQGYYEGATARPLGVVGTNVQVEGVDEGDVADISEDGRLVAVARGYKVLVYDLEAGGAAASIEGPGGRVEALAFVENRLLAIVWGGLRGSEPGFIPFYVELWLVDLEDPAKPRVVEAHKVSGSYVALRVEGGDILLVTDATPEPRAPAMPWLGSEPLTDESLAVLDPLPLRLVQVTLIKPGSGAESIVTATGRGVRVVAGDGVLALAWSTPYSPSRLEQILLEAASEAGISYERPTREAGGPIRLARLLAALTAPRGYETADSITGRLAEKVRYAIEPYTTIAFIGYEGGLRLLGTAEVRGVLLDQFALHPLGNGLFVAATTVFEPVVFKPGVYPLLAAAEEPTPVTVIIEGGEAPSRTFTVGEAGLSSPLLRVYAVALAPVFYGEPVYNSVYVVSADGRIVGSLEGFGEGLRLRAARLVEDVLYIVAYTSIDPVYVIDIADPENPELLAALYMPGWSEYLHYLGGGLLLGVGYTDDFKNRIVLIDVSNPSNPVLIDEAVVSGVRLAIAEDEYHAFNFDPETRRAYFIAINHLGYGIGVLAVEASNDGLKLVKLIEAFGAMRVFAAGDKLVIAAWDYIALYDRETLEPIAKLLQEDNKG